MIRSGGTEAASLGPVPERDRLVSLDVLRGVAVLGILAMNIRLFAMPQAAYFNPTAYGDPSGVDQLWFWFTAVFADQKFMTLFSILFGAGMALISQRASARGQPEKGLLARRNAWLLVLGLLHAYLVWYGDILVTYALCGFVIMFCRHWKPRTQLMVGLLFLLVPSLFLLAGGLSFGQWPEAEVQAALQDWAPNEEAIAEELSIYRGGWLGQLSHRVPSALEFQTVIFPVFAFWRAGGLMLLGMALFRWGWLTARRTPEAYRKLMIASLGLSIPAIGWGLYLNERGGWSYAEAFFLNGQFNYWGSVLMALGYISLVMLWCLGDTLPALRARFAAVGRTAFSCYIAQSLICTLVFYGHGLGQFGRFDYWQQALLVVAVWVLLLFAAPAWLARYRFGPMEWLWRSLTYWQRQPMRRG